MILAGQKEAVAQWICDRIRDMPHPPKHDFEAIGFLDRNGEIIGGVIYNYYAINSDGTANIFLTAAGDVGWFTKKNLRAIFGYPFLNLNCCRVTVSTAKANKKMRNILERLGFAHEGTLRNGLGVGRDCLLYGMTRESCVWIK